MPYTITRQGDAPILLAEISDPFDFLVDARAMRTDILEIFVDSISPFFVIYDVRKLSVTFNDIVTGLTDAIHVQDGKNDILEKYARMSLVGAGPLITLIVKCANRFIPSSGEIRAFDTPEKALEYAHLQVVDPAAHMDVGSDASV